MTATTRRRKKKPNANGKRPSARLRRDARRNIARWKKSGRRCVRRSGIR